MARFVIHDEAGAIIQVMDIDPALIKQQLQPGQGYLQAHAEPHDRVDVAAGVVVRQPAPERPANAVIAPQAQYAQARAMAYPPVEEQLGMLWHAMRAGQIPMALDFYEAIAVVKDAVPKDGPPGPNIIYTAAAVPPVGSK